MEKETDPVARDMAQTVRHVLNSDRGTGECNNPL